MISESAGHHPIADKLVRTRITRRRGIRTTSLMVAIILVVPSCEKEESSPTGTGNTAPELCSIGDQVVQAGRTSKIILTASDEDGDALNFNSPTNPGFISISSFSQEGDTATAVLSMEPGESLSGNYSATVGVSDGQGGEDRDADQNIWVGTHSGLAKFNGVSWIVYDEDNSGLSGNWVDALAVDTQGNVWTGSGLGDGVSKFDGTSWTVYKEDDSDLPIDWINVIAGDAFGTVWIGTEGGGLVRVAGADWEIYDRFNSGMPSNLVNTITFDPLGNTWVGMEPWWTGFELIPGGLAKFDGTNWTVYSSGNSGLPVENVWALAVDQAWTLWIGTGLGLASFDGTNWTVYTAGNSGLPDDDVNAVAIDEYGNKWLAPMPVD